MSDLATLKYFQLIEAELELTKTHVQALRLHLGLAGGGEAARATPPAPTPAPQTSEPDQRPDRCQSVPQRQCGLVNDDEEARQDLETLGGSAWRCYSCGYRSDRDE